MRSSTTFKKGHKHSAEVLEKIRKSSIENPTRYWLGKKRPGISLKDELHPGWKGEKAGYQAKHIWIRKTYGKASEHICGSCFSTRNTSKGTLSKMEWANISGEYRRSVEDWIPLCALCHHEFDGTNLPQCLKKSI